MSAFLRVDVAGCSIYVRSEHERQHLEQFNGRLTRMKMALHRVQVADSLVQAKHIAAAGLIKEDQDND